MNQLTVSLWGDEAWAATLLKKDFLDVIKFVSKDTSPPLYYITGHLWTRLFGLSEISLRSLSMLFWLVTAMFTAKIAHHFWKDKKITTIVFALTLLNPFLFQYAFEARMYAILAMTSTIATYFFLKKNHTLYIISAIASLYCHHFSLFVIFWHFLWTLGLYLKNKKNFWSSFRPFFLIGLLYLPWLPFMYRQTTMVVDKGFWLGKPILKDLPNLYLKFIIGLNQHPLQSPIKYLFFIILLFRRWRFKDAKTNFLIGWLCLPAIIVFLLSQVAQPIFYDRYLINLIPALTLILASNHRRLFSPLSLIFLIFLLFRLNWWFFTTPTKRPFRDLAAYIKSTRQPDDSLINWSGNAHHLFESKYYDIYAPIYTPKGPLPFYTGTALMEENDQISILPDNRRLGVITSEPFQTVELPGYTLNDHQQFQQLSFSWWQKNP
ncbi:hypothetical protein KJ909_02155 [Patescibacteria group bacterium]|nr:hypothetical protein [Patescibacteria group bacterium]